MADPSFHAARTVAALTDVALEGLPLTDVDRIEDALLADVALEGEDFHPPGYWLVWEKGGPA